MVFEKKILDFQDIANKICRNREDNRHHAKLMNKFSPTELVGCPRMRYWNRVFPVEFDDRSFRNFFLGDTFHEVFQDKLEDKEFVKKHLSDKIDWIENEKGYIYLIPLEKTDGDRVMISGRLDTIFFIKGEKEPIVVDYKTTSNVRYNEAGPKAEHIHQLNFYLATNGAYKGILVYIDKKDLRIVQHDVDYSDKLFNDMVDFAINLYKSLKETKIPIVDIDFQKKHGNCVYCDHKGRCKNQELALHNNYL